MRKSLTKLLVAKAGLRDLPFYEVASVAEQSPRDLVRVAVIRRDLCSAVELNATDSAPIALRLSQLIHNVFAKTSLVGVVASAPLVLIGLVVAFSHIAYFVDVTSVVLLLSGYNTLSVGLVVCAGFGAFSLGAHAEKLNIGVCKRQMEILP